MQESSPGEIIRRHLAVYVRRLRRAEALRRTAWTVAFVLAWLLAVAAIDFAWPMPVTLRQVLVMILFVIVCGSVGEIVSNVRKPVRDWIAVARAVESVHPSLRDRLTTVVTQRALPPADQGSGGLTARVERDVADALRSRPPMPRANLRATIWTLAAVIVAAAVLSLVPGFDMPRLLARQLLPASGFAPVTATRIELVDGDRIVTGGESALIIADVTRGEGPVEVVFDDGRSSSEVAAMTPVGGGRHVFDGVIDRDVTAYVRCGDATTATFAIKIDRPNPASRPTTRAASPADRALRQYRKAVETARRGRE